MKASKMPGDEGAAAVRSEESAKNSTQSYSAEAQAPLASHTNPNSRPGITFAHQDSLPKLPIPDLDSSCKKYIAALKPLQSPKEHNDTVHSVEDFLKSDGLVLQEKLKKYASGKANYIEQFCKYHVAVMVSCGRSIIDIRECYYILVHELTYRQGTIHISTSTTRWCLI